MVLVVTGPVVQHHALRRCSVPDIEIEGKQRDYAAVAGRDPVAEVMAADLSAGVGEAFGKGLRFRKQQQTRVLVSVGGEQNDRGGLEVLFAASEVCNAGGAAI